MLVSANAEADAAIAVLCRVGCDAQRCVVLIVLIGGHFRRCCVQICIRGLLPGHSGLSVKKFPFLQTDDWWFQNGTLKYSNSYFIIKGHTSVSGCKIPNRSRHPHAHVTVGRHLWERGRGREGQEGLYLAPKCQLSKAVVVFCRHSDR